MTAITINDKEYDSDNFTEEQVSMFNEARMNADEAGRAEYISKLHNQRSQVVLQQLVDSLDTDQDQGEMEV